MIRETYDFAVDAIVNAMGDEVSYLGTTVPAVYGSGFSRVQSGDVRVSSRRPEIMARLDDLPTAPEQGHEVAVRDQMFEVASVQPDVEGVSVTLVLKVMT
ncbi:MAG TPA: hypothetical protein VK966_04590 [Longimicrobiales bacterium]|nr:hypothetical protein [Longimicrobiales bacterium]